MKSVILLSSILTIFTLFISGCTSNITGQEEKGELPRELSTAEKKLVEADHSFSFGIFKKTIAEEDENVFISPLSISMALGMTMNGANGETYTQMRETLAFQDIDLEEINSGYQSLSDLLTTVDPKVKMQIANSVWSRQGFPVEENFTQSLKEYFNAESSELDFQDPKSVDVINGWVNDNTNGLIEDIIEVIPGSAMMYLINAIYFKGDWTYQFEEDKTRESPFHLENGETVTMDMMNQKRDFNIYFSDEVKMIDLPYGDSLFSMKVLMPADKETSIDDFAENQFTPQNFNSWIENLTTTETQLRLPKFEMEYEITLNDILKSMGMENAFMDGGADFTGINPNSRLFITEVKHKTFVSVDEVGTEAAAVTSVEMGITSAPEIPTMIVDRPFIFVIHEQNSGAVLFMGKLKNPAI
ncbi:MAG: serpin family protein [Balneolaceae bacterium]